MKHSYSKYPVAIDIGRFREMEARALDRIKHYVVGKPGFCSGHSGGKDSSVVHHLVNMKAKLALPVIHTSKFEGFNAIHPATLEFIYSRPFVIELYPEGTKMPYLGQVDGTRADESERSSKSNDLIVNGEAINRKYMSEYNPSGLFNMQFVYPIFDWTDEDVWAYHKMYDIPHSEEYDVL
jgi:3'-phosphoadenosine 5'-phosphosulfate sulfotransferase (PAPS reductase)/FAD synthetase